MGIKILTLSTDWSEFQRTGIFAVHADILKKDLMGKDGEEDFLDPS